MTGEADESQNGNSNPNGERGAEPYVPERASLTEMRDAIDGCPHAKIAAVTIHPSAVRRQRDREDRADALASLVADLMLVSSSLSA